jgi:FeS assembly protein SufD
MNDIIPVTSIDVEGLARLYDGPTWLKDARVKALMSYKNLPYETSLLFNKYTNADAIDESILSINYDYTTEVPEEVRSRIDELKDKDSIIVLQSGTSLKVINMPRVDGVIVKDIKDACNDPEYSSMIESLISRLDITEDRFLALEYALFNSGYFIYIKEEIELEHPIVVINILDGSSSVFSFNLLLLDKSSKVRVVQELYSERNSSKQGCFELNLAYIGNNSHVEMITTQGINNSIAYFTNRKAFLHDDSRLNSYMGLFGGKASRCKVDNILEGRGASAEHFNVIFADGTQVFDVTSNMIHLSKSSIGRVLSKAIVKDKARSLFKGMIRIAKDAKGSESYLAGHAIILNKGARADSIPALEIETNEVKATHSASVAQMDEEQIFYMMSRGMSRDDAKRAIVFGFVEPLLSRLSMDARIYTTYLVDCKWRGRPLILQSDDVMKEIWEVEEESRKMEEDIFEKHYKYR